MTDNELTLPEWVRLELKDREPVLAQRGGRWLRGEVLLHTAPHLALFLQEEGLVVLHDDTRSVTAIKRDRSIRRTA